MLGCVTRVVTSEHGVCHGAESLEARPPRDAKRCPDHRERGLRSEHGASPVTPFLVRVTKKHFYAQKEWLRTILGTNAQLFRALVDSQPLIDSKRSSFS